MMKKICFFAHNNNLTGANRSMLDLIDEMKKYNQELSFVVVIPKKGVIEKELDKRGIEYKIIRSFNLAYHINGNKIFGKIKTLLKRILNHISYVKIKQFIMEYEFDLIHVNSLLTYEGAKVAEKLSIPYVWHIREFLKEGHKINISNINEVVRLLKKADVCIGISFLVAEKYKKMYDLKNIVCVYNGLSFDACKYERKENDSKDTVDISVIGRISASKGQMIVLNAYISLLEREIKNLGDLYIIGSPEADKYNEIYEQQMKTIVRERHISDRVIFVPYTNDVLKYRKMTDITIVSSEYEAFGRVTIEGMLAQQVVIASNSGANPELISDNETGLLFELNNFSELSRKMEYTIVNNEKRKLIQLNGYHYAIDNFSIKNTALNIYKIYERVLLTN